MLIPIRLLSVLAFLCMYQVAFAQPICITDKTKSALFTSNLEELIDSSKMSIASEVASSPRFVKTDGRIPVFSNNVTSVWFRFSVHNQSISGTLFLSIAYPNLSRVSLYRLDSATTEPVLIGEEGTEVLHTSRVAGSPNLVYDMQLPAGRSQQYLLHVNSEHPIIVPGEIFTYDAIHQSINLQSIIFSLYLGVLAVMFLYNLFLFYGTRDYNYLYYVMYIFFLALAQTTLAGYQYRYVWPSYPGFNKYAVVFTSTASAFSGLLFSMHFLRTFFYAKKMHRLLQLLMLVYVLGLISCLFSQLRISYSILNYNGLLSVLSILATCWVIAKKGFKPAYFYLIAWLLFLLSFIILILRNLSVLPYNNFTTYVIYFGSAIEVALLSIALADKITMLKKEKESSQADALHVAQENEKLVRDQNIMLERKVAERTEELQQSNTQLSTTIHDLQEAQSQLVEAEKMASLGQLTAGIAHEINNPINFVKSNIKPLQLDVNDLLEIIAEYDKLHATDPAALPDHLEKVARLKKEIDIDYLKSEIESLMKGIQEGAERTAEIVMGLRNFSRLDESDIKTVNIHEGLDSTLVLLKNQMPDNIRVVKDYQANGTIECLPGKLNQVFMNIMSNALQAMQKQEIHGEEKLFISTKDIDNKILITIKDTGPGMTEEVKHKIFEPFFTTKDVGQGTGLGLSIVFKIIQRHEGKIEVNTSDGNGAEFIITLFHTLPETAIT